MRVRHGELRAPELTLGQKFWQVNWGLLLLVSACAGVGLAMLFSAANGDWDPWASRHAVRFGMGVGIMLLVALIDIRLWMRYAYLIYTIALLLLLAVEVAGTIGMGAQRWIDLKFFQLQPSEVMKIALVLALARYFHTLNFEDIGRVGYLLTPALMVAAPVILILRQPDLGTAVMLAVGSAVLFFLAGVRLWKFILVGLAAMGSVPIAWNFLHDYQKKRILTFLDPEKDPLGSGYHILQSKIAMGSGGMMGKGFIRGTQSHLNFLPEKQTDFIFTMLAEEFGLMGGLALMALYALIMVYGFGIAVRARSQFARLVGMGVTTTFSLYVFINIAMVMGVIPVVGVPLPLVSYGGTAMLTVMIGFGLLMNVYVHRDTRIGRRWSDHG
ncbi:rod shape-determining protein RodA [Marivibrio halodurans]|uniref:Peptidoglycan glycosyltransferase MrdB n=1 Tax=Marivibrio halodurans TaxID=2039722 RepID=A0A8J7SM45_9PROT|nr:rod shape-determining protein RodA [Marivibrio halodurans]MBP5856686.1 rod shape-determining protein RodA [Marivibrio halodurans]